MEQSVYDESINIQQEISQSQITNIRSYCLSALKEKIVINTDYGFVLLKKHIHFTRFEKYNSPFYINGDYESKQKKLQQQNWNCGVQMSAILDSRHEIALIPQKGQKYFASNHVYIYDYELKVIIYKNSFFSWIKQIQFTDENIIVSNNKRVIIYGYIDDEPEKNQDYYIDLFTRKDENTNIRYLSTQFSRTNDEIAKSRSGEFVISHTKPYKLVYLKESKINKINYKVIVLYEEKYDREKQFDAIIDQQTFAFSISSDGKYLSYTESYGRNAKIYSLEENKLKCLLRMSITVNPIVNQGFFMVDGNPWYLSVRAKESGTATMHLFNINKGNVIQYMDSQYKRYMSLFQKTFKDYGVAQKLIGPDYYIKNNVLYSFSLCGIVYDVLDFKRSGHHPKKNVQNFVKWTEEFNKN